MSFWDAIGSVVKVADSIDSIVSGLGIGGGSSSSSSANANPAPNPIVTPSTTPPASSSLAKAQNLSGDIQPSDTLNILQSQADKTFQEILRRFL